MADPNAAAADIPPVDASIIAATQELVGGLIERPRMAPNLLNRPPYRFIHDTVTGIVNKTSFFQGLFAEAEITNPAAHSRDIKTSFLKKLIDALMMITGKSYTKPSRILAGMDADQTNILFQDLVSAARNVPPAEVAGIVQRTLAQQGAADAAPQPPTQPVPVPSVAAAPAVIATPQPVAPPPVRSPPPTNPQPQPVPPRSPDTQNQPARVKSPVLQPNPTPAPVAMAPAPVPVAAPAPAPAPAPVAPAPATPAAPANPAPPTAAGPPPSLEQYAPIVAAGAGRDLPSQIKLTMDLLNQIITRPRLSDRLLSQPPLKFLADICASVIAATGFPQGLFAEVEFNLTSAADKAVKASFCHKLVQICAVGMSVLLGPNYVQNPVGVRRITAGQEPENTNWLLQELAVVACSSAASHPSVLSAIQQLADGAQPQAPIPPQPAPPAPAAPQLEPAPAPVEPTQPPAGIRGLALNAIGGMTEPQPQPAVSSPPAVGTGAGGPVRPMAMPRLALGDITKPAPLSTEEAQYVARPENTNVEMPSNAAAETTSKPAGAFNRPRTARIGPPRIRTNVVDDKPPAPAEAERLESKAATGVIAEGAAAAAEEEEDEAEVAENPQDLGIDASGEHGMLVNRMFAANGATKSKAKEQARPKPNAPYSQQQLEDLRQQIQKLCQSANPLGKCMEMVYEDMDQMNRELSLWKNAYQEQHDRLEEETRETSEVLAPLQKKLDAVQQAIEEQEKKLVQAKAAILRNDASIKKLLDT